MDIFFRIFVHCIILPLALFQCISLIYGHNVEEKVESDPVIILSMDGFRYDYLQRLPRLTAAAEKVNYFDQISVNGVSAPRGIQDVFTTKTFPNHYTLVTGLYEEDHGVVANFIYDNQLNQTISLTRKNQTGLEKYYHGVPIWATYGRQLGGDKVACFMWIGCSLPIDNFTLNRAVGYRENVTCRERVQWLAAQLSQGARFILIYIDEPDRTGHRFGPDSKEMDKKLLELNDCLGSLLLVKPERVNFLLVSDHGMTTFTQNINIESRDDLFTFRGTDYSELLVDPKPGKMEATMSYFKRFKGLKAFRKSDIPRRWHYGHNVHVSHVLVVADPGYRILVDGSDGSIVAGHGYDTDWVEMRPSFLAEGPAFGQNKTLLKDDRFGNIDVYLLLCLLTGLQPRPNNGSCDNIRPLLRQPALLHLCNSFTHFRTTVPIVVGFAAIGAVVFSILMVAIHRYLLKRGQKRIRQTYGLPADEASNSLNSRTYNLHATERTKKMITPLLAIDSTDDDEDDEIFNKPNQSATITDTNL